VDFGDILSQWDALCAHKERERRQESNKLRPRLPNAPRLDQQVAGGSCETGSTGTLSVSISPTSKNSSVPGQSQKELPKVNPMDLWLRRYGVVDKDSLARETEEQERSHNRKYLKKLPVGAKIDLHGLTRDEAWERLDTFIGDCRRRGIQKVLIVHGKGHHSKEQSDVSVLSTMVRTFVELDRRLGASGHPDKKLGGSGATWAIIKKTSEDL
jgi:DNA-nicking Smr family endonuclease